MLTVAKSEQFPVTPPSHSYNGRRRLPSRRSFSNRTIPCQSLAPATAVICILIVVRDLFRRLLIYYNISVYRFRRLFSPMLIRITAFLKTTFEEKKLFRTLRFDINCSEDDYRLVSGPFRVGRVE